MKTKRPQTLPVFFKPMNILNSQVGTLRRFVFMIYVKVEVENLEIRVPSEALNREMSTTGPKHAIPLPLFPDFATSG